ncbi:MAG: D-alanyl-D-alanine carboxypeptidase, partial [Acidimicrobiaceae bacterium]|nr:D-alanyl-D-alanine carboxypeptidase [Acidimicrobiaceae bacterium]
SILLGALLIVALGSGGGGGAAGARSSRQVALPSPTLTALSTTRIVVPGRVPVLSWPAKGQAAIGVQGVGLVGQSPRERSVPIASLTKMMTAYVILEDHPLAIGQSGPTLQMGPADVAAWSLASQSNESNVIVRAGEVLNEYQLLEALLIPSADNIADRLGTWDAGSDAAFVAKMNATARQLHLSATHYADASGVNPGSRSDAADVATLAADLMSQPVIRQIVSRPQAPFPVAGTIWNYNPALGVDGIIGVKSGFTSQAGGCLATAAYRTVGGHQVMVVSVSIGQPDGLAGAARADEQLLTQASGDLVVVPVSTAGEQIARVRVPWSNVALRAVAPSTTSVVGWPHLLLTERLVPVSGATLAALAPPPAPTSTIPTATSSGPTSYQSGAPVGAAATAHSALGATANGTHPAVVGTLQVEGPYGLLATLPLSASGPIPSVPAGWAPAAG